MTKPFLPNRRQFLASTALGLVRDPLAGELIALEPRIVFDGAALAVAVEAAKQSTDGHADGDQAAQDHSASAEKAAADAAKLSAALAHAPAATDAAAPPRQVVFIDSRVPDLEAFKASAGKNARVVVVDAQEDGLAAISRTLAGMKDVEAVHIVSHGAQGAFSLGRDWVDTQTLKAREADIQGWAASLSADADILLYGCDIASGEKGSAFMAELARETGADVAASADAVGKTASGTDWSLEKTTGTVEATALAPEGYGHELATSPEVNVTEWSDNVPREIFTRKLLTRSLTNTVVNDTNDNTPTFSGTYKTSSGDAVSGATIRLYLVKNDGSLGDLVAVARTNTRGEFNLTVGSAGSTNEAVSVKKLAEGVNHLRAIGTETGKEASGGTGLVSNFFINVDTEAPVYKQDDISVSAPGTRTVGTDQVSVGYKSNSILTVTLSQTLTETLQQNGKPFTVLAYSKTGDGQSAVYTLLASEDSSDERWFKVVGGQAVFSLFAFGEMTPFQNTDVHVYIADSFGNFRSVDGNPPRSDGSPGGNGAVFKARYEPVEKGVVGGVTDSAGDRTGATARGGATDDVNPKVTIKPEKSDGVLRSGYTYMVVVREPGSAVNISSQTITLQEDRSELTFDQLYLTTNGKSDGKKLPPGIYNFIAVTTVNTGDGVTTTYDHVGAWSVRYDPNPPDFTFSDATGETTVDSLSAGALTDGVTLKGANKAPGSKVTVTVEVWTGSESGGVASYDDSTWKDVTETVTVNSDGTWSYKVPPDKMGSGLKKIKATVTDESGRTGKTNRTATAPDGVDTLQNLYLTGAWSPGGIGFEGMTSWFDASSSLRGTGPDTKLADLSGTGRTGSQIGNSGPTQSNDKSVLNFTATIDDPDSGSGKVTGTNGFKFDTTFDFKSLVYAGDLAEGKADNKTAIDPDKLAALRSGDRTSTSGTDFTTSGLYAGSNNSRWGAAVGAWKTEVSAPSTGGNNLAFGIVTDGTVSVNGAERTTTGPTRTATFDSIGAAFTGRFGTTVTYDRTLSAAERLVLSNALSERYGTALATGTDRFVVNPNTTGGQTFKSEIGGIAETADGSTVSSSGNGGLVVTDRGGTESFFAKNDNASIVFGNNGLSGAFKQDQSTKITSMDRVWAVDVSGDNGGTVDLSFDVASLYSSVKIREGNVTRDATWQDVKNAFEGRKNLTLAWRAKAGDKWQPIAISSSDVIVEGGKITFKDVKVGADGLRDGFITLLDGPRIMEVTNADSGVVTGKTTTFEVKFSESLKEGTLTKGSFKVVVGSGSFRDTSVASVALKSESDPTVYLVTVNVGVGDGSLSLAYDFDNPSATDDGDNVVLDTAYEGSNVQVDVDTRGPIATITLGDETLTLNQDGQTESTTVTFTFDEAPTGFDRDDVAVTGGELGDLTQVSDTVWTATFTAAAGTSRRDASITVRGGMDSFRDSPHGNVPTDAVVKTFTVDTVRPKVSSISRESGADEHTKSTSVEFRVAFSEAVTGVDTNDFEVTGGSGGTIDTVTRVDAGNGVEYVVKVTGLATDGRVGVRLKAGASVLDVARNALDDPAVPSDAQNYAFDRTPPKVLNVTGGGRTLNSGDTATVTFTFDEAIKGDGLDRSWFTVANVIVSDWVLSEDGKVLSLTVRPDERGNGPVEGKVALVPSKVKDLAGNPLASAAEKTFTVDTSQPGRPAITGYIDNAEPRTGEQSLVGPGAQPVTNDTAPVLKGTAAAGAIVKIYRVTGDSPNLAYDYLGTATLAGTNWTYEHLTLAPGEHRFAAKAFNGPNDATGSEYSDIVTLKVDTAAPDSPIITRVTDNVDPTGQQVDPATLTSGGRTNDATPTLNGRASGNAVAVNIYKQVGQGQVTLARTVTRASGNTGDWTWDWTPDALGDAEVTFTAKAVSAAGVESETGAEFKLTVDTAPPSVTAVSSDQSLRAGETTTVTFTFDDVMDLSSISPGDFEITRPGTDSLPDDVELGVLSDPSFGTTAEGKTTVSVTYTPPARFEGEVRIRLNGPVSDLAENASDRGYADVFVDTRFPAIRVPSLTVQETSIPGSIPGSIGRLTSDDSAARFALASDPSGKFEVSETGEITAKSGSTFDHEAVASYTLKVTATDAAGNVTTQDVTVAVTDVNEPPTGVSLTGGQVNANDAGAAAGRLSASDPDRGQTFTFTSLDDRFEVDGDVLRLKPGVSLSSGDGEATSVRVRATDQGGLSVEDVVEVRIIPAPYVQAGRDAPLFALPATAGRPFAGSDPVNALKMQIEAMLDGPPAEPIDLTFLSRTVSTVTVDLDGSILGPGATGSFGGQGEAGLIDFSSAIRSSVVDISIRYVSRTADYSLIDETAPQVSSASVRLLDGAEPGLLMIVDGRLLVSRATGGVLRIALEARLTNGETVRQIIAVDTATGAIEVTAPPTDGARLHGPKFDVLVASLLQAQHGLGNGLAAAFH